VTANITILVISLFIKTMLRYVCSLDGDTALFEKGEYLQERNKRTSEK